MSRHSLAFKVRTALRIAFERHGPMLPFVMLHRMGLYGYRKSVKPKPFQLAGRTHRYFIHPYILDNERIAEIAVVKDFLQARSGDILEVGNVLPHFFHFPHDIVDKYEKGPGVLNEDVVTFAPGRTYDAIVTISTLEHVGWDEQPRDSEKLPRAIAHLKSLLKPSGEMIATMPLGYNPHLDELIRAEHTGFPVVRYLKRTSSSNTWREASLEEVAQVKFGSPFSCANAIMIGYAAGTATQTAPPR
jgi:hypothetical protein